MARVRQYRCSIVPWRARLASDGPTAARTTAIARAPVPPHRLRPAPGWFPRRSNAAGARASTARASSPRETAEPRADPAVAAGELVDQRDAVAGEVRLHRRTHPHSASEAGQTSSPTAARPIPRPCSTANSAGPAVRALDGSDSRQARRGLGTIGPRHACRPRCAAPYDIFPAGKGVTDEQLQSAVRSS
jgi:hypothetical protein